MRSVIQNLFNNGSVQGCENTYIRFETKNPKCKQRHQYSPLNTNTYGRQFADDTLKYISSNEIYLFSNKTPIFFHMVQIDNTQTLLQVMA